MPKLSGNLQVERLTNRPKVYTINDSVLTSGLTITAPFPGHIKLVASGITVSKRLTVLLSGGEFEDGEEFTITVQQSSSTTEGKILNLNLNIAGSSTSPGFFYGTNHDQGTPVPHDNAVTVFKFVYNKTGHYFIQMGVSSVYTQPQVYGWDWASSSPVATQTTISAMSGMWTTSEINTNSFSPSSITQVTNPIHIQKLGPNLLDRGVVIWATIVTGDLYILYTYNGISLASINVGAVSGTILQLRGRLKSVASNKVEVWCTTTTNIYEVTLITDPADFGDLDLSGSITNVTALDTTTNGNALIYKDSISDILYFADAAQVKSRVFGGSAPSTVATLTIGGGGTPVAISAMARTPDGVMAIMGSDSPGSHGFKLSSGSLGVASSFGSEIVPTLSGSGSIIGLVWDRRNARWVALDDGGKVYGSSSIAGTGSWTLLKDLGSAPGTTPYVFMSVGDAILCRTLGSCIISVDGGSNWNPLFQDTVTNTYGLSGVTYLKGRLLGVTSYDDTGSITTLVTSLNPCHKMSPLDFDR